LSELFPDTARDSSHYIRRAYIDYLGILPTTDEIDWYCVYNENGYDLAVEWIIQRLEAENCDINMAIADTRNRLKSSEYLLAPNAPIPEKKFKKLLFYVSGEPYAEDPIALKKAKIRIIENAQMCASGDTDVFDYMANQLMSRSTTMEEANTLLGVLREGSGSDIEIWLKVLEKLLTFDDVASR
jgi:hypothetical protein